MASVNAPYMSPGCGLAACVINLREMTYTPAVTSRQCVCVEGAVVGRFRQYITVVDLFMAGVGGFYSNIYKEPEGSAPMVEDTKGHE